MPIHVTLKQIKKEESLPEHSWWFAMYEELWVVFDGSLDSFNRDFKPGRFSSKEDALLYIIEEKTSVILDIRGES